MRICEIKGCKNPARKRAKLCNTHDYRLRRYGNVNAELIKPHIDPIKCLTCREYFKPICKTGRKYCNQVCYFISKFVYKKPCSVKNCVYKALAQTKGLCITHYVIWRNHGDPEFPIRRRKGMGSFQDGYKRVQFNGKTHQEHRHLMEKYIGRKLKKFEVVH